MFFKMFTLLLFLSMFLSLVEGKGNQTEGRLHLSFSLPFPKGYGECAAVKDAII